MFQLNPLYGLVSIFFERKKIDTLQISTFFWLIAWIWLCIDFFAEYLDVVFMMCGKIENSHGGTPREFR